jgi:hypothetical protein
MMRRVMSHWMLCVVIAAGGPVFAAGEPAPAASPEAAPAEAAPQAQHSPMILETVFAAADRSLWGDGRTWFAVKEYRDLGEYSCDGVSLRANNRKDGSVWDAGLQMTARGTTDGKVEVKIRASITNPPHNHDKIVTVMLQILNGDQVVENAVIGPVGAEDNNNNVNKSVTLILPADVLKTDPMTRLRLTMTTQED